MMLFLSYLNDFNASANWSVNLSSSLLTIASLVFSYFVFEKMGEEGWKGLIPLYSPFVLSKKCYALGVWIIGIIFESIATLLACLAILGVFLENGVLFLFSLFGSIVLGIFGAVCFAKRRQLILRCFNHHIPLIVVFFVPQVVWLGIIAFSSKTRYDDGSEW